MANEITAGPASRDGELSLLFIIGVPVPRTYTDSLGATRTVVPTPSADLPDWAQDIITQAEKDALDAGTLSFVEASFRRRGSMTQAQIATRVREMYAQAKAEFLAAYAVQFHQFYGQRIDEV